MRQWWRMMLMIRRSRFREEMTRYWCKNFVKSFGVCKYAEEPEQLQSGENTRSIPRGFMIFVERYYPLPRIGVCNRTIGWIWINWWSNNVGNLLHLIRLGMFMESVLMDKPRWLQWRRQIIQEGTFDL